MTVFDAAFTIVVGLEGGYSNDLSDPGGETHYGISKRSYPNLDIKNLTLDQAKAIYLKDYWNKYQCGQLPWPTSLYLFDGVVNQGSTAVILLQQALDVVVDGIIGTKTIQAAKSATDWHNAKFMALRAQRYTQTSNYAKYGLGWLTRLFSVAQRAYLVY